MDIVLRERPRGRVERSSARRVVGGAFMTPTVALRVMRHFNSTPSPQPEAHALTHKEKEVLKLLKQ